MSLIQGVDPKQATGEVAAIYDQVKQMMGMVPNGLAVFGSSPFRLKAQVAEFGYYGAHPTLGHDLLAAIRYAVAREHGCDYCVGANAGRLQRSGWPAEVVEALPEKPGGAKLEKKELAMLMLVLKAVRTPHEVTDGDVRELRTLGWTDQDIFDAVGHGAQSVAFDMMINVFKVRPDVG